MRLRPMRPLAIAWLSMLLPLAGCPDGGGGGTDGGADMRPDTVDMRPGSDASSGGDASARCTSPADCNDNNACTTDSCNAGTCSNVAVDPNDNNACTRDSCNPATGVVNAPIDPSDNNACTRDTCDPVTGVANTPIDPDDNDACTEDRCDPALGVINTPIDPDDNDACTTDSCDSATGVVNAPIDPSDDNACTADSCDPALGVLNPPIDPSDGNACTRDSCDPVTGVANVPIDPSDNNACTRDSCDPATGVANVPIDPSDNDACTRDSCDPATGVANVAIDPNDNNVCTTDSCDPVRGVLNIPIDPSDNDACTRDSCDPVTGVANVAIDPNDNNVCTTDSCDPATGVANVPVPVDDGVDCTVDSCDPVNGVMHTPNHGACERDGYSCTVAFCDTQTGCRETADDAPCADAVACTVQERCVGMGGDPGTGCTRATDNTQCPVREQCTLMGCIANFQRGRVIITEFSALGQEFVEIHNTTAEAIDVRGFYLQNGTGAVAELRMGNDPNGLVVPAGGYAYGVPNPADPTAIPAGAFVYGMPGTSFSIADAGDVLVLHTQGAAEIEDYVDFRGAFHTNPSMAVPASAFPGFLGVSTQLDPMSRTAMGNDAGANWCTSFYPAPPLPRARVQHTAGAANGSCRVAVINEAAIDPPGADDGNGFLEIAGPGGGQIGGATIEDVEGSATGAGSRNSTTQTIPAGFRIPVDGFLLIGDELGTGGTTNVSGADLVLNDVDFENGGGDAIQLISASGMLLDVVGYTASAGGTLAVPTATFNGLPIYETSTAAYPPANSSLARDAVSTDSDNNRNDFHSDPSPTPGAPSDAVNFTVTALTPSNAPAILGAVTVTVTGTDFATGITFSIGGNTAQICTVNSSTTITCNLSNPGLGTISRYNMTFTNPAAVGGQVTVMNGFTFTGTLNERDISAEADYCNLQFPELFTVQQNQSTPIIYGQIYEVGLTEAAGPAPGVRAEVGYGPTGTSPTSNGTWRFFPASYNVQAGNNDEYQATFIAPAAGNYLYTYRFSFDDGLNYTYCDRTGAGSNPNQTFESAQLGAMTVNP